MHPHDPNDPFDNMPDERPGGRGLVVFVVLAVSCLIAVAAKAFGA